MLITTANVIVPEAHAQPTPIYDGTNNRRNYLFAKTEDVKGKFTW